jgi:hypothetical protein
MSVIASIVRGTGHAVVATSAALVVCTISALALLLMLILAPPLRALAARSRRR